VIPITGMADTTSRDSNQQEITMSKDPGSFKRIAAATRPGYVCDCYEGSPRPKWVKIDLKLHLPSCIIYQRLTSGEYTEEVNYFYYDY